MPTQLSEGKLILWKTTPTLILRMKKYTANYNYGNSNFIFLNNDLETRINKYTPSICIVKNILQRGNPTAMSSFLQKTLGAIHKNKDFKKSEALIDKDSKYIRDEDASKLLTFFWIDDFENLKW